MTSLYFCSTGIERSLKVKQPKQNQLYLLGTFGA